MKVKLRKPSAVVAAGQCRQMGIKVGDTIVGRENYSNGKWSEAKLSLLFLGKEAAVWKVMRRSNDQPRWRTDGEKSNWILDHREWWKLVPAVRNAPRALIAPA